MELIALPVAALLPCGDDIDEATVDSRIESALTREVALHSAQMDAEEAAMDEIPGDAFCEEEVDEAAEEEEEMLDSSGVALAEVLDSSGVGEVLDLSGAGDALAVSTLSLRDILRDIGAFASRDDVAFEAANIDVDLAKLSHDLLSALKSYTVTGTDSVLLSSPTSLELRTDLGRLASQRGYVRQRDLPEMASTLSVEQENAAVSSAALAGVVAVV